MSKYEFLSAKQKEVFTNTYISFKVRITCSMKSCNFLTFLRVSLSTQAFLSSIATQAWFWYSLVFLWHHIPAYTPRAQNIIPLSKWNMSESLLYPPSDTSLTLQLCLERACFMWQKRECKRRQVCSTESGISLSCPWWNCAREAK